MKIEFLERTGDDIYEDIIRLYDFNNKETLQLSELVVKNILAIRNELALHELDFIDAINCELVLKLSSENKGIYLVKNALFCCEMDIEHFKTMVLKLKNSVTEGGYYWLDVDVKSDICLLYSESGCW